MVYVCCVAVMVRGVGTVEVGLRRVPEGWNTKVHELSELQVHELELSTVGNWHAGRSIGLQDCDEKG